ncbi:MAG: TetR/AcrR family transcriptional regulator [Sulfitobacter sp.]
MDTSPKASDKLRKGNWKQDPDAVKADILRVATEEFATYGLSGGRIDAIAKRSTVSKRMIYYYFGNKEGLYKSVLEGVYAALRESEETLKVGDLEPTEALALLTTTTFDAYAANPEFIRLIAIENIHNAEYLSRSEVIQKLNKTIIDKLADVCDRGKAAGQFRAFADPLELHWTISAFCFYNVSNQATFSASFGDTLHSEQGQVRLRRRLRDIILGSVVIGYRPENPD